MNVENKKFESGSNAVKISNEKYFINGIEI